MSDFDKWYDVIESNDGNVQFSVAILEAECGKVCLVQANLVRFIDLPETNG